MKDGRIKLEFWVLFAVLGFVITPTAGWFVVGAWAINFIGFLISALYLRAKDRG